MNFKKGDRVVFSDENCRNSYAFGNVGTVLKDSDADPDTYLHVMYDNEALEHQSGQWMQCRFSKIEEEKPLTENVDPMTPGESPKEKLAYEYSANHFEGLETAIDVLRGLGIEYHFEQGIDSKGSKYQRLKVPKLKQSEAK